MKFLEVNKEHEKILYKEIKIKVKQIIVKYDYNFLMISYLKVYKPKVSV